MITIEQVRQQLQNCGSSLRATDMKLLIDFILEKTTEEGIIEALEAVKYSAQFLTQEQKKVARDNIEASTTFLQPLPPENELVKPGDMWIDTSNMIMYVRIGTSWVSLGNKVGGDIDDEEEEDINDIIANLFDAMLEDDSFQFDGNYPVGESPDNYINDNSVWEDIDPGDEDPEDIIANLFDAMLEDNSYQFDGNYPIGESLDNYINGNLN